jgi:hypothetical protein
MPDEEALSAVHDTAVPLRAGHESNTALQSLRGEWNFEPEPARVRVVLPRPARVSFSDAAKSGASGGDTSEPRASPRTSPSASRSGGIVYSPVPRTMEPGGRRLPGCVEGRDGTLVAAGADVVVCFGADEVLRAEEGPVGGFDLEDAAVGDCGAFVMRMAFKSSAGICRAEN